MIDPESGAYLSEDYSFCLRWRRIGGEIWIDAASKLNHCDVWELFLPRVGPGARYKFSLIGPDGVRLADKADPLAKATECPPATASVVSDAAPYVWHDDTWMQQRRERQNVDSPVSVYEVHAASWFRPHGYDTANWDQLAERLVPYVAGLGFSHVELMPVAEHPFGGSWGYQPLGLFAPSGRFGPVEGFHRFVDACHRAGIGVIVDWVPAHFPTDAHGMAWFDGTALYEHADPKEGFHQDWNTYIYNLGRREVQGFLISSGIHWLEEFHVDGLRVDAVASMLYRDYSRKQGEWVPNIYGGRENLEAIGFLRHFNAVVEERAPVPSRWPRNRPPGQACHARCTRVVWGSRSNGTWAGCMTRCATWTATDPSPMAP